MSFKETAKQIEATKILISQGTHPMLLGGSRSGKTWKLIRSIIIRACKEKSKHLIVRKTFNSVKRSIWLGTLPLVLRICFPKLSYQVKNTDYYIILPNGSEIWLGGLDDKDRVEKILGLEFSTIYFNECSQIPYRSVNIALTRLSEKNFLQKKAYYDMNPAAKKHWTYRLWVKFENPDSGESVDPKNYPSLLMNPIDNQDNIDEDYISEILDQLPSKEKDRFKHGLFTDQNEGLVYYAFDRDKHMEEFDHSKEDVDIHAGMDFNVSPMTSVIGYKFQGKIYIRKEFFLLNSNTPEMSDELIKEGYFGIKVAPDSTGSSRKTSGKSDHIILKEKGFKLVKFRNPAVKDRVNNVNRLFEQGRLIIHKSCLNLRRDLEQACWLEGKNELDKKSDPLLNQIMDSCSYLAWYLDPIKFYEEPFEINL